MLGVVTISYNEERDLPGFLSNLLPWVDEIVIVDDGSTDSTEELALAAGPKVKFIKDPRDAGEYFSHQRNKGIAVAQSEWLLHMDVDERVPPKLAREIQTAMTDPNKDGYRFRRANYFMHRPMKGGGWRDWNKIHLARREKFRFAGMFHEDCLLDAPANRVGQLSSSMIHFNEDHFEKRLRKSAIYLEELVARLESRSTKVGLFHLLGLPVGDFVRKYILKKGFLDGVPGLIWAIHSATATFRAYAVAWDRQNRIPRGELEKYVAEIWKADQKVDRT